MVTPDGMKMYLKKVKASYNNDDQIKISQSNLKAVMNCMK